MSEVKRLMQAALDGLPEDCTFEDMQYRLYVLQRVHEGLAELDRGESVPHEEVLKRFEKWLEK